MFYFQFDTFSNKGPGLGSSLKNSYLAKNGNWHMKIYIGQKKIM